MNTSAVDKEFERIQSRILGRGSATQFTDGLHRRLADALAQLEIDQATVSDAAVLIRQLGVRRSRRQGTPATIRVPLGGLWYSRRSDWMRHHMQVVAQSEDVFTLAVENWEPDWLPTQGDRRVDDSALAGSAEGFRRPNHRVPADPEFTNVLGYTAYTSPGQRAAVRAALTLKPGETLICLLPTGSGKTEVALALALSGPVLATSIVVVPTVSLALDLEHRMNQLAALDGHHGAFAWVHSTDGVTRDLIKESLIDGSQRILVTSPESLMGPLSEVVLSAATAGRIRALVIDEAHLVRQWGVDFRPEFRELPRLRAALMEESARWDHEPPRTLLLSATLSDADLEDLEGLFGPPGGARLVAANSLRSEPTYWISDIADPLERERRVLELMNHAPRPLILYVSKPADAESWWRRVQEAGYRRVGIVTGKVAGDLRKSVLMGLRGTTNRPTTVDVVIATSAFGLGIDYGEIRSIVHACIPETVDRWYQEVGRGGRDGSIASAFLVPAKGDESVARSLSENVLLTAENARERWKALIDNSRQSQNGVMVDLNTPRAIDVQPRSYNRTYNRQVLQGLEALGAIETTLGHDQRDESDTRRRSRAVWIHIRVSDPKVDTNEFWEREWEGYRRSKMDASRDRLRAMVRLLNRGIRVCDTLVKEFQPSEAAMERYGAAADTVAPAPSCGQCAACADLPWTPHDVVVPPAPWGTDDPISSQLELVLRSTLSGPNLLVATLDSSDSSKYHTSALRALEVLVRHGVRYIAAPNEMLNDFELASSPSIFQDDEPPDPVFSPAIPSAIVLPWTVMELDAGWFVPRSGVSGENPPTVIISRSDIRVAGELRRLDATRPTIQIDQLTTLLVNS